MCCSIDEYMLAMMREEEALVAVEGANIPGDRDRPGIEYRHLHGGAHQQFSGVFEADEAPIE